MLPGAMGMRLTIVDRHLFREMGLVFVLALGVLLLALLLQEGIRLANRILENGLPFSFFLEALALLSPVFLVFSLPVALLVTTVVLFSRLRGDQESVVLQASGIHPYRPLLPVIAFALALALLDLGLSWGIQPWAVQHLQQRFWEVLSTQRQFALEERVFNRLFGHLVYVQHLRPPSTLEGVFIASTTRGSNPFASPQILLARRGSLFLDPRERQLYLHLEEGSLHHRRPEGYQWIRFQTYTLRLAPEALFQGGHLIREQWSLGLGAFRQRLAALAQDPTRVREYRLLALEFHKRFSLPAAVLVLALVGAPLGHRIRTRSRLGGFGLGVGGLLIYYLLLMGGEFLARLGWVEPWMAAWTPNLLLLGVGLGLLRWLEA